jgi:hypothetical protein
MSEGKIWQTYLPHSRYQWLQRRCIQCRIFNGVISVNSRSTAYLALPRPHPRPHPLTHIHTYFFTSVTYVPSSPFPRPRSLLRPSRFTPPSWARDSPDQLLARAETNGYRRGAHRDEDVPQDRNKHKPETKKDQGRLMRRDVL